MSSNFSVKRFCEFCNNEFIAKTTVTRFCSKSCNGKAHKAKLRAFKVQKSYAVTAERTVELKGQLLDKEFLLVKDVARILEYSRSSVYELILTGELRSYKRQITVSAV